MHPTLGGLFPLPPHSYLSFDSTFKTYLKFFHFSPSLIPPNLFKSTTISYWDSAIFPIISFPWIVSKLSKAKNQVIYLSCLKIPKSSSLNIEKYILSYFHWQRPILISVVSFLTTPSTAHSALNTFEKLRQLLLGGFCPWNTARNPLPPNSFLSPKLQLQCCFFREAEPDHTKWNIHQSLPNTLV